MTDKLRLPEDLGRAIRAHRRGHKLKAVEIARHAGRSRDVLHRLEQGRDVSVASLMDILRAMDLCLRLEPAGLPTLEEMQRRFGAEDDEAGGAA